MNTVLEAREPSARYFAALEPPLLQQFDLIASAPNGVTHLRELILTLAVQGKLEPQHPDDEPASALLERIRCEKAGLVKDGKIRKDKPLAEIAEDEKPFVLPPRWEWARIGEMLLQVTDGTHHTPKYLDSGVAFISVKDIDGKSISFADCKYISEAEHQQINTRCNPERGDMLLCRIGTLGRPTIVDTDRPFSLFVSVGLLKLPKSVDISKYLHRLLSSPVMAAQYDEIKAGGSHTNKLNLGDIPQLRVPTPPLAEQSRIVARVEELMALCDALEAKGKLEAEQHARLVGSLFESLANSESAHALAENWQRIATHFDLLLDRPAAVDALEQTILQLAVRGLLVPQDLADEPASALLQQIRNEKGRLIAAGKIKRDKTLPPISDEEKPFALPKGWEWARLGSLAQFIDYRGKTPEKKEVGIPLITAKNIRKGHISRVPREFMDPTDFPGWMVRGFPKLGDILFTTEAPLGNAAVVDIEEPFALAQRVICFGIYELEMSGWLLNVLLSSFFQEYVAEQATGVTAQGIKSARLQLLLIPIPPIQEQSRIVARVAELRTLCAQLREHLASTAQTQSRLAEALIEKAVA